MSSACSMTFRALALQVFPDLKVIISLREPIRHVCSWPHASVLQAATAAACACEGCCHVCVSRQRHGTGTTTGRCIPADAP